MSDKALPSLAQIDITALKGVGKQLAEKLARLHIYTLQDLLFHLPSRYLDRTKITPIGALQPGQNAVIQGIIKASDVVYGRRRSLMCRLQDGTGTLTLRFYHFSGSQKAKLTPGSHVRCYGEARRGSSGLEMYHPEYEFYDEQSQLVLPDSLTPVYPVGEGITQSRLRGLISQLLPQVNKQNVPELLPSSNADIGLAEALHYLHQPPVDAAVDLLMDGLHPYQQRLAFEELLAHNLSLLRVRDKIQASQAPRLPDNELSHERFLSSLSFKPTGAQERVIQEISHDINKPVPMLRLVQGDVGSGKTLVAAAAALQAIANGYQVALMAPTEILAEQHRQNFNHWFEPLGVTVGHLNGKQKASTRKEQLAATVSGENQLIVGTHALFQNEVEFADLGLVIIDEQHRFGVHQRMALRAKGQHGIGRPHQLVMTATPIPRTLAMSAYADLDISVIDELPPGRSPVSTALVANERRQLVIDRVKAACSEGRQAYWVCTLIEESEALEAQAAEVTANDLQQQLSGLAVGLIHGRLKPSEKEAVMAQFKAGEIKVLVATTVIEVGVDVPNASLMIIENPERLGLAQLHQLRGRVGRGSTASHCVLLYGQPLSEYGRARLSAMRETNDGFKIAERDLELRGPGEVLGTKQTGEMQFKLADLQRDANLIKRIRDTARDISTEHPELIDPIIQRWLGQVEEYAQV
ncbi:ATP-dependent DNA helicase RecG [uncultured Pseudoteredinibacter sp.]|uniref:ATP-dependent DNA helicase RecG n=1 Tax=uncultured Pseudoteredinibacter sp. TaxID=1641701 RepID=UPI00262C0BBA|nr:ATP-dependent DNA helicase RecG [uncultured Pseudoteredinibacter sp.]